MEFAPSINLNYIMYNEIFFTIFLRGIEGSELRESPSFKDHVHGPLLQIYWIVVNLM